jgi:hypothetical protein
VGPAERPNETAGLPAGRLVFTQAPVEADLGPKRDLPGGSRIVSYDPSRPEAGVTNLTRGFSAAGRPDVSFDGKRVLFTARRSPDDPFNAWEMNADGSGLRRITNQTAGITEAIYLSTIYTINDSEPAHQIAFGVEDDNGPGALYTCRMDGTQVSQVTFDPYGATDPCQLSDGRLLFSGGRGPALLTVNTDGTDVFVFAAAHEPFAWRGMPCETDDGWIVYVESPEGMADGGGSLVAVSRTASLHSRRVVADRASGLYRSPAAAGAGTVLVAFRPRDGGSFGLYLLDLHAATRNAEVYDDPQWHELDAAVVRARPAAAGRSSVVNEQVPVGMLYCLDAYLSGTQRSRDTGDERIEGLQVFRALTSGGRYPDGPAGAAIAEELLGTVPVEPDGSIHLSVPVRTPLRLETIGPDGRVLQVMHSWFWVMPGERRGCIGCHEDRELSPPNRHPLALRKPPHPVGLPDETAGGTE